MGLARSSSAPRTVASIALGAFAVHQLRYFAGYGDGAGAALGAHGHGYLHALLPLLIALGVSATLGTWALAAYARRGQLATAGAGWAFCTAALLAIFTVQESAEGLMAEGHPGGVAALTAHGGWIVLPIAAVIGRLIAWLLGGMASIERALAGAFVDRPPRPAPNRRPLPRAPMVWTRCSPLAFGVARRPPPLPVS